MDFDHRNITDKMFTVSQRLVCSLERLIAEVDKCDLVCANCHRIRTADNPNIEEKRRSARGDCRHSQKTKDKISLANSGRVFSSKHIFNLSASHIGKKLKPESIAKRESTKAANRLAAI
jgi:hypothetical protein